MHVFWYLKINEKLLRARVKRLYSQVLFDTSCVEYRFLESYSKDVCVYSASGKFDKLDIGKLIVVYSNNYVPHLLNLLLPSKHYVEFSKTILPFNC